MSEGLSALVKALKRPHVVVVGDLILDKFLWGTVNRISPEAPIQILDVAREEFRPGGSANVARNLAALGARVTCAGVVGRDESGRELRRALRQEGIRPMIRVDRSRPTPSKTRMIAHQQQVLRVDSEDTAPLKRDVQSSLIADVRRAIKTADVIVVSDYHKGTLTPDFCRVLLKSKKPVLVGLKGREASKYIGATAASLNRSELAELSGTSDLEAGAQKILKLLRLQFLVATLGERGMAIFPSRGKPIYRPAAARDVFDVTGAGDTALATIALAYASGIDLEGCAELANTAAGIVVGKMGTETVSCDELRSPHAVPRKIFGMEDLVSRLKEERERGRRVVFTNGCFDLLHAGHIRLLEFARSRGDVLVVALNSDASVRRLKGKGRPILSEAERGSLIAALEAVDYVIFFSEATPEKCIRKISPDVLVKGQDYQKSGVVGGKFVERAGGRIELAPLVRGVSTTDIVKRILNRG